MEKYDIAVWNCHCNNCCSKLNDWLTVGEHICRADRCFGSAVSLGRFYLESISMYCNASCNANYLFAQAFTMLNPSKHWCSHYYLSNWSWFWGSVSNFRPRYKFNHVSPCCILRYVNLTRKGSSATFYFGTFKKSNCFLASK